MYLQEIPTELHINESIDLMWPSIALAALTAASMIVWMYFSRKRWRSIEELTPTEGSGAPPLPDHCVVIPARNEEKTIEAAVASFPGSLVLVVDDESKDRTAELAEAAGATVRAAGPRPPKWRGKAHACWTGAECTESDWIVFVDGDTHFEPAFLPALLRRCVELEVHCASVLLEPAATRWHERALAPYATALRFCAARDIDMGVARPIDLLIDGRCLVFSRQAYLFAGGHKAAATEMPDDVALARLLRRHALKMNYFRSGQLGSARMGLTFAEYRASVRRNARRFMSIRPRQATRLALASTTFCLWAPLLGALAWQELWWETLAFALLPALTLGVWYRRWTSALWAPVAIYVYQLIGTLGVVRAMLGIRTTWKGRRV